MCLCVCVCYIEKFIKNWGEKLKLNDKNKYRNILGLWVGRFNIVSC